MELVLTEEERELLEDVRNYNDITYADSEADRKLWGIICRGRKRLDDIAGSAQDYKEDGLPRSLLFDYVRYFRNGAGEYFEKNFISELLSLELDGEVSDYAEKQQ